MFRNRSPNPFFWQSLGNLNLFYLTLGPYNILRNPQIACEQALCLGKIARKGKGKGLFPLSTRSTKGLFTGYPKIDKNQLKLNLGLIDTWCDSLSDAKWTSSTSKRSEE